MKYVILVSTACLFLLGCPSERKEDKEIAKLRRELAQQQEEIRKLKSQARYNPEQQYIPSKNIKKIDEAISYDKFRFFEAGEKAPDIRDYKTTFQGASARYIYTEVTIKNLLWQVRDNQVNIKIKYFKPDGTLFGEPVIDYNIPKDWQTAELWTGWGWPDPGNWSGGKYRVEIHIAGKKVDENSFEIKKDQVNNLVNAKYVKHRFFESGAEAPDLRNYKTTFNKGVSRYIYTEVTVKNLLWKIRDNPVTIVIKYYKPDGTLFGEPRIDYNITKDWESAELWTGWGWPDPGNWQNGKYRIEIYLNGKKETEDFFTVEGGLQIISSTPRLDLPQTISSVDGKFSILAYSGMTKHSELNQQADIQAANPAKELYIIVISEKKTSLGNLKITQYHQLSQDNIIKNVKVPNASFPVHLLINGNQAIQSTIEGNVNNQDVAYILTAVETHDHFHQVLAWTSRSKLQENSSTLQNVIRSFRAN